MLINNRGCINNVLTVDKATDPGSIKWHGDIIIQFSQRIYIIYTHILCKLA